MSHFGAVEKSDTKENKMRCSLKSFYTSKNTSNLYLKYCSYKLLCAMPSFSTFNRLEVLKEEGNLASKGLLPTSE